MKFYLSSYKLGNEIERLKEMVKQTHAGFGYVPNALDFTKADPDSKKEHITRDMEEVRKIGVEVELLDLKDYFNKENELKEKLASLSGLYISGGNVFVLRQAMQLSGFDNILLEIQERADFIYSGYSAGVCVLSPSLKPYAIVDDAKDMPYAQLKEQIWDGLGILDFAFEPHYKSDHPESEKVDEEVQFCIDNKILFKAYQDGEVLIL